MAIVSIFRGLKYEPDLLSETIEKIFAAIPLPPSCKRVLLKPNIISARLPEEAATTHPAVVEAVCKYFKKRNIEIWIGESSALVLYGGTGKAFRVSGIAAVAKKYGARLISFETSKRITLDIPGGEILKKITVPEEIKQVDAVINLPKLKSHSLTIYTGAVKNLFGLVGHNDRIKLHKSLDPVRFAQSLLEIYSAVKPQANIIDGILAMEKDGPTGGATLPAGIMSASDDALALDWTICGIIDLGPEYTPMMKLAGDLKLLPEIKTIGDASTRIEFKKPVTIQEYIPPRIQSFIMNWSIPKIRFDKAKCIRCGLCVRSCPVEAITLDQKPSIAPHLTPPPRGGRKKNEMPVIDTTRCIRCFCCHEVCPNNAVLLKDSFPFSLLRRLRAR